MTQPTLPGAGDLVAHCFFVGTCSHTETGHDPDAVHAAMERHYDKHDAEITCVLTAHRPHVRRSTR